ncbi:MAG: glycosyltransferase, partial [Muribaculaceae bacterium]
ADLHDHFPHSRRHDFMPNPCTIDTSHCAAEREKVVIAAGRLVDQKDFAELLRIWAQVAPHAPGWRLRIIGEGGLRKSLEKQAADLGIANTVELPGFTKEVRKAMSSAEIYAMTSRYEGMPLVLIEAMSCGLPIVSYDLPYGPSDIITDGVDGYLVPNRNADTFARRLLQLIAEPDLRRAMGENGRKRSADYAPEAIARRWMQKYSELLGYRAPEITPPF